MISIVCPYRNNDILKDWLLRSLESQTAKYEIITVDTAKHGFKSAAQALNFGGEQATGKYIMFVHQDIDMVSSSWLEEAEAILDTIPDLGIAGVVGSVEAGGSVSERMRNVIAHGDRMEKIGNPISSPERVQTLDELLLIVPREVFERYRFDETTCDNWHLYGTDYCLSMLTMGKGVYVIPFYVIHKSKGASSNKLSLIINFGLSKAYYRSLEKVLNKHKDHFTSVYTTPGYGRWKTAEPLFTQRLKYSVLEMIKWLIVTVKSCLNKE
jgi:GT2 family glycosyltransferase